MARYIGPTCKLARREGTDLLLKSRVRALDSKCNLEKTPGQMGERRRRTSDYALQLREKQKVKRMYGLLEAQFRGLFKKAEQKRGVTGTNLLIFLERRLDNVVYRSGFANSRTEARQLVRHNHFTVNGRKMNIPSYLAKIGDVIEVREKSRKVPVISDAIDTVVRRGIPAWLEVEQGAFRGTVKAYPIREQLTMPIQEQLIVELYSK